MCDKETGKDAFFTILGFNGGSLQNIRGVHPPEVSINKGIEALLFELAVKNDEKNERKDQTREPAPATDFLASTPTPAPAVTPPELEKKHPTPENIAKNQPTTSAKEQEMTEIQKILAEFISIEGVHTACLVGRDGFLLDNLARAGIDAEMIGAIASSGFGSAESMGNQLGQGDLKMTMFEFANGPVMFAPVGEDAFLVIVADQETNLGWIRISIKKNSKKIKEIANL
jgi:predicted regulator of Ras-like GTPase activity (Roadblock/LC7/MglB family)